MLALLAFAAKSLRSTQCRGCPSYCDLAGRSLHCLVLSSRGASKFAGPRLCKDPGIGLYSLQEFAGWRNMLQEKHAVGHECNLSGPYCIDSFTDDTQ